MKKTIIIIILIIAAAALLAVGICIRKNVRRTEKLCAVTYRSQFGYVLSMKAEEGRITVTYLDEGREPIVKEADGSCYDNLIEILETYGFRSWRNLSGRDAKTDGFNTLELGYEGGKTLLFSESQDLPENAQGIFSVINTCLMEYAGIVK